MSPLRPSLPARSRPLAAVPAAEAAEDTTPEPTPAAATDDPRVGPLMDLVRGLLAELGDVATACASHIPDPAVRDSIVRATEKKVGAARARYSEILLKPRE